MALKGDRLDGRFAIPGAPEVDQGINVVVGVTFDAGARRTFGRCKWKSSGLAWILRDSPGPARRHTVCPVKRQLPSRAAGTCMATPASFRFRPAWLESPWQPASAST